MGGRGCLWLGVACRHDDARSERPGLPTPQCRVRSNPIRPGGQVTRMEAWLDAPIPPADKVRVGPLLDPPSHRRLVGRDRLASRK
jgi:hypothetical protein